MLFPLAEAQDGCKCPPGWAVLCLCVCCLMPGSGLLVHQLMPAFHSCGKEMVLHLGKCWWRPECKDFWDLDHEYNREATFFLVLLCSVLQRHPGRPLMHFCHAAITPQHKNGGTSTGWKVLGDRFKGYIYALSRALQGPGAGSHHSEDWQIGT